MNILGICDNHDAGAALFLNNKLHSCINEERLNREKLYQGFPYLSIDHLLKEAKLKPPDIDLILVASDMTPSFFLRLFRTTHKKAKLNLSQFSILLKIYVLYHTISNKLFFPQKIEKILSYFYFKILFKNKGFKAKIKITDHHMCHAFGAYSTSGLKKALIFTMDAMGDGLGITVNIGKQNIVKRIYSQSGLNAPGFFYSKITEILGFKPNYDEGKITGLAAYGNPNNLIKEFKNIFKFNNGKILVKNKKKHYLKFKKYRKEDVAASAQKIFEQEILKFIEYWIKKTQIKDICLSGGVFLNVKLNQRIHESKQINSIYVFPHMGDGGLALGAIYSYLKPNPKKFSTLFLGLKIKTSESEISNLLKKYNMKILRTKNIYKQIANLLVAGKIIAIHRGNQEFGPRALGNHSILCKANNVKLTNILNKKLKRTEFMPFAPVTLDSYSNLCYDNIKGAEYTSSFMTITLDCKEFMKKKSPGVVHIDDTARPQILKKNSNPFLYNILTHYYKLTKIPSLINTSFNIHEEPIVFSYETAIKSFIKAKLDYLVVDNLLTRKK